jgi:hypothetical protein
MSRLKHPRTVTCLILAARALALPGLALLVLAPPASASALNRDRDPVVLAGLDLPTLVGVAPGEIVAFRYASDWVQIPVQVDERANVDFGTIYGTTPTGFAIVTYTDTSTFTGPDPDPGFDADDELVLRSRDTGERATADEPPGTITGSGVELVVHDPVGGDSAYAYFFLTDGSLAPGAGVSPIAYNFNLLSGAYKTSYSTQTGPNPEDSDVITAAYGVRFSDRWIRNETWVSKGGASAVNILDRHKSLFGPGNCTRSEKTFSAGEGAFIINHAGPVRALRGYVGCNSGPTSYRIHAFYEEREDVTTGLRVHPIPGIMDYFDYSPQASGMTFYDNLNVGGFPIDGNPDPAVTGQFTWEMVTGTQGTLVMTMIVDTDIPGFDYTSYYSDDATPQVQQCTGDAYEYGASGFWENDAIPNTDPGVGSYKSFLALRIIAYAAPGKGIAFAEACAAEAQHPLTASGRAYVPYRASVAPDAGGDALLRFTVRPNPTAGLAAVDLVMPVAGKVRLDLYDVSGRRVATPFEGRYPAGRHHIRVPMDDLPGGIYFLRAVGPNSSATAVRVVHLPG